MIRSFDDALAGTGKTFVRVGTATTGEDTIDSMNAQNPRFDVSNAVHDMTARNIRSILVAVPPVVHSRSDRIGFVPFRSHELPPTLPSITSDRSLT